MMLTLKNVTITQNNGKILIEDLNLVLNRKQRCAVIGEEGNGKSTLLKALVDKNLIQDYASMTGHIEIKGKLAYLPQTMDPSWYDQNPIDYCLKEHANETIKYEMYNELADYEKQGLKMHLPVDFLQTDQLIGSLSGGEKVRLQLLKLCTKSFDVLIMDEPTNDLDIDTLEWLERFLVECDAAVLFVSHDEELLKKTATSVLLLESVNKKTKVMHTLLNVDYEAFVSTRTHMIERQEMLAAKEKSEYEKKMEKLNRLISSVHDYQNDVVRDPGKGRRLKKKMHSLKSMEKRFEKESYTKLDTREEAIDVFFDHFVWPSGKIIIDKIYPVIQVEDKTLIKDVHLFLKGSNKLGIIGKNGCGKTTLMRQIVHDLKERTDIKIGYMPQNYAENMNLDHTPIEYLQGIDKESITKARDFLGRMKFTRDEMLSPMRNLSEGQKAKCYLLKFIIEGANVLCLDEPTRNLSPLSAPVIREILSNFDGAIITVSHDRMLIEEVCDTVYEVKNQQWIKIREENI